jgi:hypothetical protein
VQFDVTNSGAVAGGEGAQVYVGTSTYEVPIPVKQLKGFRKVQLNPGQTGHVQLNLDMRSFAFWDTTTHNWKVTPGQYQIYVGSSSRDIRLQGQIAIAAPTEVAIDNNLVTLTTYKLEQNYPNPFNPSTSFTYELSKAGFVSVKIYDLLGREVATLANEFKQAGVYSATWNAASFGSGVYFCKMQSGSFTATRKVVLMK